MWFGAQRALLLQLAHPAVAAAVDEHSAFREHPHRRLSSTADGMILLLWGNDSEIDEALGRVGHIHDRVNGRLPDSAPPWRRGDRYTAHDRSAQAWVWATLVETSRAVYERYVQPLSTAEADRLYEDWQRFGLLFGIDEALLPADRRDFAHRWTAWLEEVRVTPSARRVAIRVLDPPMRFAPRRLKGLGATFATVPLPLPLRAAYDHRPSVRQLRDFVRTDAWLRRRYRTLPTWRATVPDAYLTVRRAFRPLLEPWMTQPFTKEGGPRRPRP